MRHRRRDRLSASHLSRLASQLTARDRRIALDCYDHRALTTEQLRRLHFANLRTAQRRLQTLYELRVLERFRPPWQPGEGSTPHHWTLDEGGARLVAETLGLPRAELAWSRDSTLRLAGSTALAHQLAVNEFTTRLAVEAKRAGGTLQEWWGERRAAAAFAGALAPDGYVRLELDGESIALLLELDRGTEPRRRLEEKARAYAHELPRSTLAERDPLVLLLLASSDREAWAADKLPRTAAPIVARRWTPDDGGSPLALVRAAHLEREARR